MHTKLYGKLKKFQGRSLGCYFITGISDVENNPRNFSFREIYAAEKKQTRKLLICFKENNVR